MSMADIHGTTRDQLRAFVERIERLEEEKAALAADVREVYAEAKSMGFDVKTMRTIVRMRKQDVNERQEQEAILATYMIALGMVPGEEPEAPAQALAQSHDESVSEEAESY